jgi:hypothetical protein
MLQKQLLLYVRALLSLNALVLQLCPEAGKGRRLSVTIFGKQWTRVWFVFHFFFDIC